MAINEILPFAPNAKESQGDILSQEDYQNDPQRLNGQSGLGRRALNNKALRQAIHIAAGVAQFIANRYAGGVKDDGDLNKVEDGLVGALQETCSQITFSPTAPSNPPPNSLWIKNLGEASNPPTLSSQGGGGVVIANGVFSPTEPADKSLIWFETEK